MPLVLDSRSDFHGLAAQREETPRDHRPGRVKYLEIGLLNNMPDGALRATERHYVDLLGRAAGPVPVRLHVFSTPDVPRSKAAQSYIGAAYQDFATLPEAGLDALIVTGAEPKAAVLTDEPYWSSLAAVIDWAEHRTISTIWSCLAAHAAVLHLDGIARQRLAQKHLGLFECVKTADDPLLGGAPTALRIPHSRWNDLSETALRAHGYRALSRSMEVGIDLFTKQWRSRFVYFQGHPEYGTDTLYREFRRDVQRYLQGEVEHLPSVPVNYFDIATEHSMRAFLARAQEKRGQELFTEFPVTWALCQPLIDLWQTSALQIFRNWINEVALAKG